jgi:outer membrane protein
MLKLLLVVPCLALFSQANQPYMTNQNTKLSKNGLTLKDILKKSVESSADLVSKAKEVESYHQKYTQARAEWLPKVDADFSLKRNYPTEVFSQQSPQGAQRSSTDRSGGITVRQNLYKGGQTVANMKAVDYGAKAKQAEYQVLEQKVITETIKAYCEIMASIAAIQAHKATVEATKATLINATQRQEAGAETSTQTAIAHQRYADAQAKLRDAEMNLEVKKAILLHLTGISLEELGEESFEKFEISTQLSSDLKQAEIENPNVIQARFSYLAAKAEINASTDNYQPEIELEAGLRRGENRSKHSHDQYSDLPPVNRKNYRTDRSVGVNVKWNLFNGGATAALRREKGDMAVSKQIAAFNAKNQVIEDFKKAVEEHTAAKRMIALYKEREGAARVAYQNTRAEVLAGSKVLKDELDALNEVQQSILQRIEAEKNMKIAYYNVLAARGKLNSADLNLGTKSYAKLLKEHYQSIQKLFY